MKLSNQDKTKTEININHHRHLASKYAHSILTSIVRVLKLTSLVQRSLAMYKLVKYIVSPESVPVYSLQGPKHDTSSSMLGGATVVTCKYLHLLLQALQSFLCSFIVWVYPAKEGFFFIGTRTQRLQG
jgi:hypothetical protein